MKWVFFLPIFLIVTALYSMDPSDESDTENRELVPINTEQAQGTHASYTAVRADVEHALGDEFPDSSKLCSLIRWTFEGAPYIAGFSTVAVGLIRDLNPETQVSTPEGIIYYCVEGAALIKALVDVVRVIRWRQNRHHW